MRFLKKVTPEVLLRLGLGLMYLYSGYDLVANPQHWYGFVPRWFSQVVVDEIGSVGTYLRLQGAGELLLGILFLAWFLPRRVAHVAAFFSVAEMALILLFVGVDPITFRDIGLAGAATALVIMSFQKNGAIRQV